MQRHTRAGLQTFVHHHFIRSVHGNATTFMRKTSITARRNYQVEANQPTSMTVAHPIAPMPQDWDHGVDEDQHCHGGTPNRRSII